MSPGVKQISCRAPANGAEKNRLVWRTSLSRQTKRSRMEWKVGAGARKVRLLLWIAQVECQLSLAPPISTNILWSADARKAISFHAHCPWAALTNTGSGVSTHSRGRAHPPGLDPLLWGQTPKAVDSFAKAGISKYNLIGKKKQKQKQSW